MQFETVTPILRIFDQAYARAFYLEFLGFEVNWEHRFEEGLPLYMEISRGDCVLHLSEHNGDCCPGAAVRIEVVGLQKFHAELIAKDYPNARPELNKMPWGSWDMPITDPFGNRLIFTSLTDD